MNQNQKLKGFFLKPPCEASP